MMNYKFTTPENRAVFIIEDDNSCKTSLLVTGVDPDNTDYQTYLKWVAEGNTPLPADEGVA
jgi:hypothetical protein